MELLNNLWNGLQMLAGIQPMIIIFIGVIAGILGGAIPGISPSMAVALFLPFTFNMSPTLALVLLVSIYKAANFGGSITAITINSPGTPSAVVTSFDGYPLAQQGKAGMALGVSLVASVAGGLIGTIVLILFSVPLAKVALSFWPQEYFMLAVMGMTTVATLGGENWKKALVAVLLGLLLNTIGLDPILGTRRFTFGVIYLFDGFSFIPVMIGLFALSEVFMKIESFRAGAEQHSDVVISKWPRFQDYWKLKFNIIRTSLVGTLIGIFPGAGGTIASFISYDMEKRLSKHPEMFGKGSLEGVAAAESSNSSSVGGALVPLLSLGIPGSATAAVLIGALMMHDLAPGPELFTKNPEIVYGLFASMFVANIVMLIIGLAGGRLWAKVTEIPQNILQPLIFAFSIIGSFAVKYSIFDVWTCLGFGVVGWLLKRYGFPLAPVVLGMILGLIAETNFRQAMMIGGPTMFFTRPISLLLLLVSIASLAVPFLQARKARRKRSAATINQGDNQ